MNLSVMSVRIHVSSYAANIWFAEKAYVAKGLEVTVDLSGNEGQWTLPDLF